MLSFFLSEMHNKNCGYSKINATKWVIASQITFPSSIALHEHPFHEHPFPLPDLWKFYSILIPISDDIDFSKVLTL